MIVQPVPFGEKKFGHFDLDTLFIIFFPFQDVAQSI